MVNIVQFRCSDLCRLVSAMVTLLRGDAAVTIPVSSSGLGPADLPAVGDPRRWPMLQALRRAPQLEIGPWLAGLEAGRLPLEADLVIVLADRLEESQAIRLLALWRRLPQRDPAVVMRLGHRRSDLWASGLRETLAAGLEAPERAALLPLLGYQRDPRDFALFSSELLNPGPLALRQAALEALSVGLSAWPRAPLRRALVAVASDLQPRLAIAAVDLLARLPGARRDLQRLSRHALDATVEQRLRRRLAGLGASPLLLLVHGRAGGVIPPELADLAAELQQRRAAPVQLLALSQDGLPRLPLSEALATPATLVPLLLLPGNHVRHDLPALAVALRRQATLRRLPFLGSWPEWQQALAQELTTLAAGPSAEPPLLLHHPLEGGLAQRYLQLLARRCGADCLQAHFQADGAPELPGPAGRPYLPLALAANRLTERLQACSASPWAAPLLARPRLRRWLLEALEALP